jgi:hypothetical protein
MWLCFLRAIDAHQLLEEQAYMMPNLKICFTVIDASELTLDDADLRSLAIKQERPIRMPRRALI